MLINDLKRARSLVEAGWCQYVEERESSDGSMSYCARGASEAACGGDVRRGLEVREVLRLELEHRGLIDRSIVGFNDAPFRKKEDVLSLFDDAIARASAAAAIELLAAEAVS